MRVNGPAASDPASKTKKKQNVKGAGGDFDAYLSSSAAGDAEETSSIAGLGDIAGVGALLSLQEMGGQEEANSKAYKHGEDILEQLSDLRMGLLAGLVPPEKLQNLAKLVQGSKSQAIDPQLQDILNDIEVRALVELEKYSKAKKSAGFSSVLL